MKHTPGPWKAHRDGITNTIYHSSIDLDGEVNVVDICEMSIYKNDIDAKLIETAPELLERLVDCSVQISSALVSLKHAGIELPSSFLHRITDQLKANMEAANRATA